MRILQILIPFCCAILSLLGAPVEETWNHDIYTGRHFDSLILNSTVIDGNLDASIVVTPAILVIYDPTCLSKMQRERMDVSSLPPAKYLTFAKYNYKAVEERIWYDLDDEDDLRDRYGFVECPDVSYLPKGGTVDRPVPWIQGESFLEWVWRKFRMPIEVKNDLLDTIEVEVKGRGPAVGKITVGPGVFKKFEGYISYTLVIRKQNNDKLLIGIELENKKPYDITVSESSIKKYPSLNEEEWLNKIKIKYNNEDEAVSKQRKKMATMFALGVKQPLVIPKFTDKGYNFTSVTENKLFTELKMYYESNVKNALKASLEPVFNTDDAMVKKIKLDDDILKAILSHLQPVLEEWSSCKLKFSETSGIYMFGHGTFIRPHTGEANNHALSVLLMLDSDDEEWTLEILDYNGERLDVSFKPGHAMMYESATLSHNSKTSFKGNSGALLYLHFKPTYKWNWSVKGDQLTNGIIKENIYELQTDITKKGVRKEHLYNKWNKDVHDEL